MRQDLNQIKMRKDEPSLFDGYESSSVILDELDEPRVVMPKKGLINSCCCVMIIVVGLTSFIMFMWLYILKKK